MSKFIEKLKRDAEENPIMAIGVGAAALTVVTKFMSAMSASKNARTWSKEVDRRRKNQR